MVGTVPVHSSAGSLSVGMAFGKEIKSHLDIWNASSRSRSNEDTTPSRVLMSTPAGNETR